MTGFEPAALGLGSRCSTPELHPPGAAVYQVSPTAVIFKSDPPLGRVRLEECKVAEPTGFEPAISGLTGRRVNQATPRLPFASCIVSSVAEQVKLVAEIRCSAVADPPDYWVSRQFGQMPKKSSRREDT